MASRRQFDPLWSTMEGQEEQQVDKEEEVPVELEDLKNWKVDVEKFEGSEVLEGEGVLEKAEEAEVEVGGELEPVDNAVLVAEVNPEDPPNVEIVPQVNAHCDNCGRDYSAKNPEDSCPNCPAKQSP